MIWPIRPVLVDLDDLADLYDVADFANLESFRSFRLFHSFRTFWSFNALSSFSLCINTSINNRLKYKSPGAQLHMARVFLSKAQICNSCDFVYFHSHEWLHRQTDGHQYKKYVILSGEGNMIMQRDKYE